MEWLQAYKIGKSLLTSGSRPLDAYFQSYTPPKRKVQPFDRKKAYVVTINLNSSKEELSLGFSGFDGVTSRKDGFFSSISSNFTSYYLCTPYRSRESILDFLGINKLGNLEISKKEKELIGFEKEYEDLIQKGLLKSTFKEEKLIAVRNEIRESPRILKKVALLIINLNLFVEKGKKNEELKNFFNDKEFFNLTNSAQLSIGDKGDDDVAYIRFSVDGLVLNQLPEYHEFCFNRFVSFGKIDARAIIKEECYLDPLEKEVYAVKFPRDNINLLKTSTASVTSMPYFRGDNFLLSRSSYDAIKLGAKFIDKNLRIRISNILHYIIPEFVDEIEIFKLKSNITDKMELAFSTTNFKETQKDLIKLSGNNFNSILLVGCIKGKGDIDFVNSIKISSLKYFDKIFYEFDNAQNFTDTFYKIPFSFKSIYNLFPVSSKKNKLPDSLIFFKAILEKTSIEDSFLIDSYIKLINIYRYRKPAKEEEKLYPGTINIAYKNIISFESRIEVATKKYLVLFNLLSKIYKMENQNLEASTILKSKTETFFKECNYNNSNAKKALFYLGKLIRKVALAQSKKQKGGRKPILDKINYSGMSPQEIQWLFCEVIEKLKQYEKLDYFVEQDMESFSRFFALADKDSNSWQLSSQENTFYLFTGYSMFFDVIEKKDKDKLEKEGFITGNEAEEVASNVENESSDDIVE